MKYNRIISTAVMFLLLGCTLPAFAQKGEEEKGGGKAQPAQHQAQPQRAQQQPQRAQQQPQRAQQQPQRTQQVQRQQQPQRTQQVKTEQPQRTQQVQRQQQPQRTQQVQRQQQPQRTQQVKTQQPQRTRQVQAQQSQRGQSGRQQTQTVAANRGGGGGGQYGRISNANYGAHFGHEHSFHMGRPWMIGGYNRFQYGGYWFGFNSGWPIGWDYDDDVYVEYIDGAYYMFDLRHPGIQIALNIF